MDILREAKRMLDIQAHAITAAKERIDVLHSIFQDIFYAQKL